MAVLLPPPTPYGYSDLVTWDIPIVTTDIAYNPKTHRHESFICDSLIPELLLGRGYTSQSAQVLLSLQEKISSAQNASVYALVRKIVRENTTQSHPTIALIVLG